ncbi:hypothetical protein [Tenacibaculum sp.]|uniref:hypothetical protein n=1 Tax=Tenacibaculum sp. TaxID=1906242 RepID=UPI003D0A7050
MREIANLKDQKKENQGQTIIVKQKQSNGAGIAGFVLSIIGMLFSWFPIFGWLIWASGLILSLIGIFEKPRGLAIAGLVISLFGLTLLLLFFVGLAILGAATS